MQAEIVLAGAAMPHEIGAFAAALKIPPNV
jgi:hypothetical protein